MSSGMTGFLNMNYPWTKGLCLLELYSAPTSQQGCALLRPSLRQLLAENARERPRLLAVMSRSWAGNIVRLVAGKATMANDTQLRVGEGVSAEKKLGKKLGGQLMSTTPCSGARLS